MAAEGLGVYAQDEEIFATFAMRVTAEATTFGAIAKDLYHAGFRETEPLKVLQLAAHQLNVRVRSEEMELVKWADEVYLQCFGFRVGQKRIGS